MLQDESNPLKIICTKMDSYYIIIYILLSSLEAVFKW
jgi:hypothetical protein